MGPSGNGLVGADERRAKNSAESRAYRKGAPVRFQKAVSRSKENAAVERRKARRSALWTGSSLPAGGTGSDRKTGQWVRRSAPANFGAPLPSFWECEGFEQQFGTTARRDAPRGNAPARFNTCTEKPDAEIKE